MSKIDMRVHKSCITERFPSFDFQCCIIYSALELIILQLILFSVAKVVFSLENQDLSFSTI